MVHTLRHLLTPGTPIYALLKLAAVGLLFALYMTRAKAAGRTDAQPSADEEALPPRPQRPHPVSKKKRRKRR